MKRALFIVGFVAFLALGAFAWAMTVDALHLYGLAQYCAEGCHVRVLPNGMLYAVREQSCLPTPAPAAPDPVTRF